jgi:hypothetical protein
MRFSLLSMSLTKEVVNTKNQVHSKEFLQLMESYESITYYLQFVHVWPSTLHIYVLKIHITNVEILLTFYDSLVFANIAIMFHEQRPSFRFLI